MPTSPQTQVTPERLMQLAWSFVPPMAIEAAVRNGLLDALDASSPQTISELQQSLGVSERGLRALADMLVGIDLLAKNAEQRYSLTPESATFLVSTKPSFRGGFFRRISSDLMPDFLQLSNIIRDGVPKKDVQKEEQGAEFFAQLVPELLPMNYPGAQALAKHIAMRHLGDTPSAIDIASGSGVWGIALAQEIPNMHVTAVDWPLVIPVTKSIVQHFGVADRFSFIKADIRIADLGSGYSVATLGHILHSEGEENSRKLLKHVFDALAPGGVIAIAEFLVNDDRRGPVQGLIFNLNMLVHTEEGRTFSFEEIRDMLQQAGFVNVRTLEAPAPSPLILADKPGV